MLGILIIVLFSSVSVEAFCTSTGCANDDCTCVPFFTYCNVHLDTDGQCTLSRMILSLSLSLSLFYFDSLENGIWTIAAICVIVVVLILLLIMCACCCGWCKCRRKEKEPNHVYVNVHHPNTPYPTEFQAHQHL